MKIKHLRLLKLFPAIVVIFVIMVTGCGEKKQQQVQAAPKIPVVNVEHMDVPVYQEFVGQISGFQDISIRARVEGFLEGIHFKEGGPVKSGQLLYTIDPQQLQAKVAAQMSNVAEATTMLAKAQSDLNRIRPLAENNAVSKSDLDAAVAQFEAAQASLEAAKANLESAQIELSYTKIKSPINGIIGKTQAKVGDFVGRAPNPIVLNAVSNIETVLVEFFLSEREYLIIVKQILLKDGKITKQESGEQAAIKMILADGSTYSETGHINFVDREVNPSTGSLLVQASFPNPDKLLRPGQFARVVVEMEVIKDALIVPKKAISEVQGQFNAYVVNDSSRVVIKPIKVRTSYKDYFVVSEGLNGNEKIVIDGIQKIKSGMTVKPEMTTYKSKQTNIK
ncbi:MAG: efflux RND transporter periplasmic adaptor subunit [Bacteroidales bacterium]|nr:efflux RND transporter periplasmic adaptor subunit [Bacteroidales bacterium]